MTMPTRRQYQAGKVTTLTTSMTDSSNSFTIADATNWPDGSTGNFWVTIDPNTPSEERVLCSARSTTTVTVAASGRGKDGTIAIGHANSAVVWPSWSAQDADEANAHVSATGSTGSIIVHGLAVGSNVVGTTDTQTLTNKTVNLSSNTLVGTVAQFNTALSDGNFATIAGSETLTSKTLTTPVISIGLNPQTSAYTLQASDKNKLVTITSSSTANFTVPSGVFSAGDVVYIARLGTGAVAATASGTTVNGTPGLNLRAQYSTAAIICTASNTFLLVGDLAA